MPINFVTRVLFHIDFLLLNATKSKYTAFRVKRSASGVLRSAICTKHPTFVLMLLQVISYQIADSIDIKAVRSALKIDLLHADADELFYQTWDQSYLYVFKYGVVCFLNCEENKIDGILKMISPFCKNLFEQKLSEEFQIETA